ncbi:MAG: iron ABC transporter permease [Rhizorhabdus sp.]|nr:MAG: iron ABC transporter permease [Rhizorhabdus sp.]
MTIAFPRRSLLIAALACTALLLGIGSLLTGPTRFGTGEIAHILAGGGDPVLRAVLLELRLPRALLGLMVGGMLGLGGAVLQGYLRNPLAEPSVLGTSNAAALGAVIALYFGLAQAHPLVLPLLAIAGALLGLAPLLLLAGRAESPLSLILAGIAVGTLAGAGISLALNLAPNPFAAMEIMSWLMGSLEDRSFDHIWLALPCIAAGGALLLWNARSLDALTLGEDAAQTLGVDLRRLRLRLLIGIAIGIGGAVAVTGAVGFVGLIVPHLLRPLTDRAPSALLLPSALGGAALLSAADIAVRLIPTEIELRLGVLTALLGVPVFLYHLARERRLW